MQKTHLNEESFCLFLNANDIIMCVLTLNNTNTIDTFWPMKDKTTGCIHGDVSEYSQENWEMVIIIIC